MGTFDGQVIELTVTAQHLGSERVFAVGKEKGQQVRVLVPNPSIDTTAAGDPAFRFRPRRRSTCRRRQMTPVDRRKRATGNACSSAKSRRVRFGSPAFVRPARRATGSQASLRNSYEGLKLISGFDDSVLANRRTNLLAPQRRWPVGVRGGDWDATALTIAVLQGDADLTRFLLEHGASWQERHGHDDNVHGTLAWASRNHDPEEGDWVGCARALIEHGLPVSELSGDYSDEVS